MDRAGRPGGQQAGDGGCTIVRGAQAVELRTQAQTQTPTSWSCGQPSEPALTPPSLRHVRAAGFIDSDEYVLLQPGVPSLPALLDWHSGAGGVRLHWRVFSAGQQVG